jgi:hypothetical protein
MGNSLMVMHLSKHYNQPLVAVPVLAQNCFTDSEDGAKASYG